MAVTTAAVLGAAVIGAAGAANSASKQGAAARDAARKQSEAAGAAIEEQQAAAVEATGFFDPFAGAAERGVEASSFLANPQAQFDFLQSSPLFQLALDNANQQTDARAASRGRLSAGDTLQDLSNNVLLSAAPLIDRQRSDIGALLNLGTGVATSQANIATGQAANIGNLLTDAGAAQAAGVIGAANANSQNIANLTGGIQSSILALSNRNNGGAA